MDDDREDGRTSGRRARPDRADRSAARYDGRTPADGDIRARVQQIAVRQRRFERYLTGGLGVDHAGLHTMDQLISGGPATPTQLAEAVQVSTAAMTLVLNRLEAAGHVRRDRHPSDGRKLVVTAAPDSAERAHDLVLPLIDGVEQLVATMTAADRRVVVDFLDQLIGIYDSATAQIGPPGSSRG